MGKLLSDRALLEVLAAERKQGRKVVFTNGCFDIIHAGHVMYLEDARNYGDLLVVGINTDRSVRSIKGSQRPINSLEDRARVLAALSSVDFVVSFDEPDPYQLICAVRPDVLVKGADWPEDGIVGRDVVEAGGGRVVRIPLSPGRSTSAIIQRILAVYGRDPGPSSPIPPACSR
jgi:D-beta-D-heptose 7-phosphate kinase/D-beta-D-heptose 1-phosphate adenosyltransferase